MKLPKGLYDFFEEVGELSRFAGRFFQVAFSRPFESRALIRQCYVIGYKSLFLVAVTGFIMGLVLTLQVRPTIVYLSDHDLTDYLL